jgi:SAM-dependent methyltransferase
MIRGGAAFQLVADRVATLAKLSHRILEVGTPQRFAKELRTFEKLFDGKDYIAAGYEPSTAFGRYNCDYHQDIECMTFADCTFDAILCLEVLEHVKDPFSAVRELKRVLRPNGYLLLTVPFLTQYHGKRGTSHGHDSYPDYWRFTHQAIQYLFHDFSAVEVLPLDGPIEFRLKQFYLQPFMDWRPVRAFVDAIDCPSLGRATTRHMFFGRK